MPLSISRLRRWFAAGAIVLVLVVATMYFYARHRVQNALKEVPAKIGIEVQQSAQGFTVSRSEQGHTLFKVQASKAVQFKQGGRTELHDVTITLYGRDSSRFDQIYGADFEYDPQSGDIVGKGEVQMDLEANPEGLAHSDQAPPKELKNPIHLTTSNLLFNQKTGNAATPEKVEFSIPEANGSAVGLSYIADTAILTLHSAVEVDYHGSTSAPADCGTGHYRQESARGSSRSAPAAEREPARFSRQRHPFPASGQLPGTHSRVRQRSTGVAGSQRGESPVQPTGIAHGGEAATPLRSATFSGDVRMVNSRTQPMQGNAGRVVLNFSGNECSNHGTYRGQRQAGAASEPANDSANAQDVEVSASVIDFVVADGRRLKRADTSGAAQIAIRPKAPATGQQTLVTAGKFQARFDDLGQLASVHGAPNARIVSQTPGQPDRVSTSSMLDASFHPGSGIDSIVQQGSVAYNDGERKAWGERATLHSG